MNLFNYKKADYYKVAKDISNYMELSDKDCEILEEYLRYSPYIVVSTKRDKPKTTLIQRLSIPIFILIAGFLIFSMPFKWILTGVGHYGSKTKLMNFMINWYQKIF